MIAERHTQVNEANAGSRAADHGTSVPAPDTGAEGFGMSAAASAKNEPAYAVLPVSSMELESVGVNKQ